MLVQLLYASRAAPDADVDSSVIAAILREACRNNPRTGITGVLCYSDQFYIQLLEGGRQQVNGLYGRLLADQRHTDVTLLYYAEVSARRYSGWVMGQVNLQRLNPATLLRYGALPLFDPFGLPGESSLALIDELMSSASVIGGA
jgi:hypothetical protein